MVEILFVDILDAVIKLVLTVPAIEKAPLTVRVPTKALFVEMLNVDILDAVIKLVLTVPATANAPPRVVGKALTVRVLLIDVTPVTPRVLLITVTPAYRVAA